MPNGQCLLEEVDGMQRKVYGNLTYQEDIGFEGGGRKPCLRQRGNLCVRWRVFKGCWWVA